MSIEQEKKRANNLCDNNQILDEEGHTALHYATSNNIYPLVELLIRKGTQNNGDFFGVTPLHIACIEGYIDIVKLFLKYGYNVNVTNVWNQTPLIEACFHCKIDIVKCLILHGAYLNKQSINGMTALHYSCHNDYHSDCAHILIENEADINIQDYNRKTILHQACLFGNENIVKLLLSKKKLDLDIQDNNLKTALHYACFYKNVPLIKLLMNGNARCDIIDSDNKKAIDYCKTEELRDLLKYYFPLPRLWTKNLLYLQLQHVFVDLKIKFSN